VVVVLQIILRPATVVLDLTIRVPMALNEGLRAAAPVIGVSITTASVATGLIASGALVGLFWLFAKPLRPIHIKTRDSNAISDVIFVNVGILAGFFGGIYFFWLIFSLMPARDAFEATVAGSLGFIIGTYFFCLVIYVVAGPNPRDK
jgi:hypothetical protein